MSGSIEYDRPGVGETASRNVSRIAGMASALVAVNVLLILVLSYTPVAGVGGALFSNYFVGIAVFVATVGGGRWVAAKGVESGSLPVAGAGVTLVQFGYALIGSALLAVVASSMRVTVLGITTVVTGLITAAVVVAVFRTDHSFERWQTYSFGLFIAGFAAGAAGVFLDPTLYLVGGVLFFLGFVADLAYEVWAVRENRYGSDLRNAIGIYVAVMGVFIHVLQLVIRVLSMLEN